MSIELTHEDMMEAMARGFERVFSAPEMREVVATALADGIGLQMELLSPSGAAELLGCDESTLRRNHRAWGLDKSVRFGRETPFYFLSQIVARAREKVIEGALGAERDSRTARTAGSSRPGCVDAKGAPAVARRAA
jgi:hypothetical protein